MLRATTNLDKGSSWDLPGWRVQHGFVLLGTVLAWVGLQAVHWQTFIYHDAWRHNFPRLYSITKLGGCGDIPRWNLTVDNGWPVVIETISSATTNIVRLPFLFAYGCLGLDVVPALFLYKIQILAMWLVLAAGAYVLGRTLFQHRLAAAFLFAAVLFASVGLDDLHSDQDGIILFWSPWIITAAVLTHRHRATARGALYFHATVLYLCLQALDHYPHFPLVIAGLGGGLYAALFPRECLAFVRRQRTRLWPAVVLVLITGVQLWIFKDAISGYVPSQRGDLIVDLSQNGETGWVQPGVLLTSFLPLSTLSGFESLANGMQRWLVAHGGPNQTMFVFRPNSLIYYMGFIPTAFCFAFALGPSTKRVKVWWLAFTLIILAIAVQETHLSYLLFQLPFFNVLRTYSLFGLFVAFGVLVMSGYGVDAYLSLDRMGRRSLIRRGLAGIGAATLLAGLAEGALLVWQPPTRDVGAQLRQGLAGDVLIWIVGIAALWLASRSAYPGTWVVALTAVVIVSQIGYATGVYHFLGIPLRGVLSNYELHDDDGTTNPALLAGDPNAFVRKTCDTFPVCYVSRRDTVSLQLDDHGTFLRNANEPVFQSDLNIDVVRALDGVNHPIFWLSTGVQPYSTRQDLVDALNAHQKDINTYLGQVTYVPAGDMGRFEAVAGAGAAGTARLVSVSRSRDTVRITYQSDAPVFLNAAINYDPAWTATVNGARTGLSQGNFNDLLLTLPSGGGEVVFKYQSPASDFLFYSRYLVDLLGLVVVVFVAWVVCRGGAWIAVSEAVAERKEPVLAGR